MSTATAPKSRPRRQRLAKSLPQHTEKRSPGFPEPAGFIGLVLEPVDFELWPVQPVITWQPELTLEPPRSSGLCIDRCHKPPVPGFLDLAPDAGELPVCQPLIPREYPPAVQPVHPQSDAALSGWDPRVVASVRGAA